MLFEKKESRVAQDLNLGYQFAENVDWLTDICDKYKKISSDKHSAICIFYYEIRVWV